MKFNEVIAIQYTDQSKLAVNFNLTTVNRIRQQIEVQFDRSCSQSSFRGKEIR